MRHDEHEPTLPALPDPGTPTPQAPGTPALQDPVPPTVREHRAKRDRRQTDTIWRENPREQGLIGLTDAIAWFGANGYLVNLPLIDAQSYDLVVDDGAALQRVQVKTTTYRSPYGVYVVRLSTTGGNQSFHTRKPFDADGCDLLYVLTDAGQRYLVPMAGFSNRESFSLGRKADPWKVPAPNGAA